MFLVRKQQSPNPPFVIPKLFVLQVQVLSEWARGEELPLLAGDTADVRPAPDANDEEHWFFLLEAGLC
jgi:hypothetical protein